MGYNSAKQEFAGSKLMEKASMIFWNVVLSYLVALGHAQN